MCDVNCMECVNIFIMFQSLRFISLQDITHFARSAFKMLIVSPTEKECPRYNTELHLMVRLLLRSYGKSEVPLHCHYSQVRSDSEWKYVFRSVFKKKSV